MRFLKNSFGKSQGLTIIELLVASSIGIVVVLLASQFVKQNFFLVSDLDKSVVMRQIATEIEMAIGRSEVIRESARQAENISDYGNKELLACIALKTANSQPDFRCHSKFTNPKSPRPFSLILAGSNQDPNEDADDIFKRTIAGGQEPVFYRFNQTKCSKEESQSDPSCEVEVRAWFSGKCGPTVSDLEGFQRQGMGQAPPELQQSCLNADSVLVRYSVVHWPNRFNSPSRVHLKKLPSIPKDDIFKGEPNFATVEMPVNILRRFTLNSRCPGPNYTIKSIEQGVAKCECLSPFREIVAANALKRCEMDLTKCTAGERFKGIDDEGKVICQPVSCNQISTLSKGCDKGSWIQSLSRINFNNSDTNEKRRTLGCKYEMPASTVLPSPQGGHAELTIECDLAIVCCNDN